MPALQIQRTGVLVHSLPTDLAGLPLPPRSKGGPLPDSLQIGPNFQITMSAEGLSEGVRGRACGSSTNSNMAPSVFLAQLSANKAWQGQGRENWYFLSAKTPLGAAGLVRLHISWVYLALGVLFLCSSPSSCAWNPGPVRQPPGCVRT